MIRRTEWVPGFYIRKRLITMPKKLKDMIATITIGAMKKGARGPGPPQIRSKMGPIRRKI